MGVQFRERWQIQLAKLAGNVVFSLLFFRSSKHVLGGTFFDDSAFVEKRSAVTTARCLLHVVRDNYDGVLFTQLID